MKKIFSKFTRERDERFQIETAIYLEDGAKFAAKRPLSEKANAHVRALYENYQYFCGKGITLFAECQPFGDGVRFEFADGETCYSRLLKAVEAGDRAGFDALLEKYKEIVRSGCPGEGAPFESTPEFEAVFGSRPQLEGKLSYQKLDLDLTLDNLIFTENGEKVIDYEWIFDFPVPLEFMYYRAVLALYVRNGAGLKAFISEKDLYGKFGISEEERELYREMNEAFNAYTTGGAESLSGVLPKYAKKSVSLASWVKSSFHLAQFFVSRDASFRTAQCTDYMLNEEEKAELELDLTDCEDVSAIRLDPLNIPCSIREFRMSFVENGEEREIAGEELRHNAVLVCGSDYVFTGEDPQIIWAVPEGRKPERVRASYRIGRPGDSEKIMGAEFARLLEKEKQLDYIQGTSAYKMFLEKKVGKVFGGKN